MSAQRIHMSWKPAAAAIGLALVVHALLLLTDALPSMLRAWESLFPRPKIEEPTQVEMISMTPQQFEQNRLVADSPDRIEPPPAPQPPPPEPEPPKPAGQIVDLAPTPDSRPPIEARFLSEHDTRVKQESVSPDPRPDYAKPKPRPALAKATPGPKADRPESAQPEPAQAEPKQDPSEQKQRKSAEQADPHLEPGVEPGSDALAKAPAQDPGDPPIEALEGDHRPKPEGEPAPPAAADRAVAMAQAGDQAEPADEGAPAPDSIHGVPIGQATFLNSREFMYASFFNRVKRMVSQFWHPSVRDELDRRDSVGRLPAGDELVTVVFVSLEPSGDLETVQLVRSSGVASLDDLALRAFHQAAPFPNPPRALAEADGRIRFQFGFTISQRYGPTTQAFRPRRIR